MSRMARNNLGKISIVFSILFLFSIINILNAADVYVSPSGSDANDGSKEKPYATIEKAQQAVRDIMKYGMGKDVIVYLRGGNYAIQNKIQFDSGDSGQNGFKVVYKNYPNEKPIVSGGKRITNWQQILGTNMWHAPLNDVENTRELYINGKLATIARKYFFHAYPWEDPDDPDMEKYDSLRTYDTFSGTFPVFAGYKTTSKYADMIQWRNKSNIEFIFLRRWTYMTCPVENIYPSDDGGAIINMQMPGFKDLQIKNGTHATEPNYVQNAFEVLDEPGEWYFDRTNNEIFYIPRENENMPEVTAIVPVVETLLEIKGSLEKPVQYLHFEGITFQYSSYLKPSTAVGHSELYATTTKDPEIDDVLHSSFVPTLSGIVIEAAKNITLERCEFRKFAAAAINLQYGAQNTLIRGCRFIDIGGNGVQIGGYNIPEAHPADTRSIVHSNVINNCYFNNIGVIYRSGIAINAGFTRGLEISHNEITNTGYIGISVGWGWGFWDKGSKPYPKTSWQKVPDSYPVFDKHTINRDNRILNNHIHHVMQTLYDGAGIYTTSMNQNSLIKGNWVHDNPGYMDDNRDRAGHPGGLYLDEATGGFEVTQNVVYNVSKPYNYNNMSYTGFEWLEREALNRIHDNYFGKISGCDKRPDMCREYNNHKENNMYGITPESKDFPKDIVERAGLEDAYKDLIEFNQ